MATRPLEQAGGLGSLQALNIDILAASLRGGRTLEASQVDLFQLEGTVAFMPERLLSGHP